MGGFEVDRMWLLVVFVVDGFLVDLSSTQSSSFQFRDQAQAHTRPQILGDGWALTSICTILTTAQQPK
jgi:hypothetical protein